MSKELPGQQPMFEMDPARPAKAKASPGPRPKYKPYKAKRHERCDECFRLLADMEGHGPLCLPARWTRSTDTSVLYLCSPHAEDWRLADNLPSLPKEQP